MSFIAMSSTVWPIYFKLFYSINEKICQTKFQDLKKSGKMIPNILPISQVRLGHVTVVTCNPF
jgi:hypothetical protein